MFSSALISSQHRDALARPRVVESSIQVWLVELLQAGPSAAVRPRRIRLSLCRTCSVSSATSSGGKLLEQRIGQPVLPGFAAGSISAIMRRER